MKYTDIPAGERHRIVPPKGLSTRDWFAGLAMLGLMDARYSQELLCQLAYRQADTMMKARR